jgi:hypothetical protein
MRANGMGMWRGWWEKCEVVKILSLSGLKERWEVVREEVNSVEGEKKVVVVGLGELKELVKLMCGGLVVPLSL